MTQEIDRLTSILTLSRRGGGGYTSTPVLDYTRPSSGSGLRILKSGNEQLSSSASSYGDKLDIKG